MNKIIIVTAVSIFIIVLIIFGNKNLGGKPILGIIAPFSGEVSSMGEGIKRSIDLANIDNMIVEYEDDQCDSKKAISVYEFLKQKGTRYYYVACSGSVLALAPLAKRDDNMIITAYAGSAEIRKTGLEVIRFNPDALSIVDVINKYIAENSDKKFAILYEVQDYAKSVTDLIRASSEENVVAHEGYVPSDDSFKTTIMKLKASVADEIIWIPVSDKSARTILKEMQILGWNKPVIGEVNLCDYPFSPADFGIHGKCWKATLHTDGFKDFLELFKVTYGVDSQYQMYDAMTYDSINILDKLVAKYNDVSLVAEAMIAGVKGEVSDYEFDSNGEVKNVSEYMTEIKF